MRLPSLGLKQKMLQWLYSGLVILSLYGLLVQRSIAQCKVGANQITPTLHRSISPKTGQRVLSNPLSGTTNVGPLVVVAIGDSVVWGDGLKDQDKFIVKASQAIADKTQRTVTLISYAHSGAHLTQDSGVTATWVPMRDSDHGTPQGDLDSSSPDVDEQGKCAADQNPGAEIVVMDGCINEVGATAIALPPFLNSTSVDDIYRSTTASCGGSMGVVLQSVKNSFPLATIVLLNYYRVVSKKSSPVGVASAGTPPPDSKNEAATMKQVKSLAKVEAKAERLEAKTTAPMRLTSQEQRQVDQKEKQEWQDNSEAFLTTSRLCFEWAIALASGESTSSVLKGDPSCPVVPDALPQPANTKRRVYLAMVDDDDTFAYGAENTHIWSYSFPFFYFFALRPDEIFGRRRHLCMTHFDTVGQQFKCKINPIAHPNRLGAQAYAESIAGSPRKAGILDAAWAIRQASPAKQN